MFLCGSKEGGKVKCFRIVLLGNVSSGKTTFCKQIVDSYLGGFSRSMKKEFRKHIYDLQFDLEWEATLQPL